MTGLEAARVHAGDTLVGKYRVDRVLSSGGMGVVVAATHLELHEPVCLKFMLGDLASNPEAVERFMREARAAVKLKGEHVCRVMDVGRLDTGAPFIVMELMHGTDLAGLIRARGPVLPAEAARLVIQACDGLAEAHELGIVHRDIKPANIFVTSRRDGSSLVKVLDFGISKAGVAGDGVATHTQALMGTPAYMSPEQMRSAKHVDARTDIWALGAVLYELVTGRPPFAGDTVTEIITAVLTEQPPPAPLPPSLSAIILRCLDKNREGRYANVGELARALGALGDRVDLVSDARVAPTVPPTVGGAPPLSISKPSRRWGVLAIAAIVIAAVGGIAAIVYVGSRDDHRTTPVEPAGAESLRTLAESCDHDVPAGCTALGTAYVRGDGVAADPIRALSYFEKACSLKDPDGCLRVGVCYHFGIGKVKDDTAAARLYTQACDGGSSEACTRLGTLYLNGEGVARDDTRAAKLLDKACRATEYEACGRLGELYVQGAGVAADPEQGLSLLDRACSNRSALACKFLGDLYSAGNGAVTPDLAKARKAYTTGCRLGQKTACDLLQ